MTLVPPILALVVFMLTAHAGRAAGTDDPGRRPSRAPASRPSGTNEPGAEPLRDRPSGPAGGIDRRDAGGPRGAGRGRQGPTDDREFNPSSEDIDRLLEFAREHFPEVHNQLVQTRRDDPKAFRQELNRLGPHMMNLIRLSRDNPKEAEQLIRVQKREIQIIETRQRYRAARSEDQRSTIRSELRRLIEEKFDARQQRLKSEIDNLRLRLEEQTRRYTEQAQRRQQIIEDELGRSPEPPRSSPRGPRPPGKPAPASRPAAR